MLPKFFIFRRHTVFTGKNQRLPTGKQRFPVGKQRLPFFEFKFQFRPVFNYYRSLPSVYWYRQKPQTTLPSVSRTQHERVTRCKACTLCAGLSHNSAALVIGDVTLMYTAGSNQFSRRQATKTSSWIFLKLIMGSFKQYQSMFATQETCRNQGNWIGICLVFFHSYIQ